MLDYTDENVLVSDTLPVRGLVTVAGLRRRGIEARGVDRAAWGTRDASLFVISFDVIGRERVRVLRQRFPNTRIVTMSDDARDEALALECGADAHLSTDIDAIADHILKHRSTHARPGFAEHSQVEGFFRDLRSGERGHLAARF